ncbi:MAG: hypothetical protein M3462_02765 [Chloroflexota bacterium]|nr:hypothetical protein [Chloroflexota bacterium]
MSADPQAANDTVLSRTPASQRPLARRETVRTPGGARGVRPPRSRPWDAISWWYSALIVVPLLIVTASVVLRSAEGEKRARVLVMDEYTGAVLPNANVSLGAATGTTDSMGLVRLARSGEAMPLSASMAGYTAANADVTGSGDGMIRVVLRPAYVDGTLRDEVSGQPISGAKVSVASTGQATSTAEDGSFRLEGVAPGSVVSIDAGDHGVVEQTVGQQTAMTVSMRKTIVVGQILATGGTPLEGAVVHAGTVTAVTDAEGRYRLTGAGDAAEVLVSASGYGDVTAPIAADRVVNATLEQTVIRALYANQFTLSDPVKVASLIEQIDTTAANALVVDVKQDSIYYDSQVPFFRQIDDDFDGMIAPLYDPAELLAQLREHDIYTIARMVVFKDPIVAEARPDLAVGDDVTGGSWRDYNDAAWVNAFNEELWDANIELALELGGLGFDEVQYDYVRFPSDGDLTTANFGPDYSQGAREGAITGFFERSSERIRPTGVKLAADLFAMIALQDNDQGIGQRLVQIAPLVDYICLMIYPSHYVEGNIDSADGHPNNFPYETVLETLQRGEELIPGTAAKQRPWLQDFSQADETRREYTADDVAAQIRATEEFGASGWLLWNAANVYSVEAFPDSST